MPSPDPRTRSPHESRFFWGLRIALVWRLDVAASATRTAHNRGKCWRPTSCVPHTGSHNSPSSLRCATALRAQTLDDRRGCDRRWSTRYSGGLLPGTILWGDVFREASPLLECCLSILCFRINAAELTLATYRCFVHSDELPSFNQGSKWCGRNYSVSILKHKKISGVPMAFPA